MSKENQKEKIKKRIREKTPKKIGDIPWAFFDLSSVAAGSQSAMQQWEWRMKNEEWRMKNEELSASPIKSYLEFLVNSLTLYF